jgi:hypothetical protein
VFQKKNGIVESYNNLFKIDVQVRASLCVYSFWVLLHTWVFGPNAHPGRNLTIRSEYNEFLITGSVVAGKEFENE